jgi:ABC-2 type transport system permease protein
MSRPGSIAWFARHELRLSWREALSMMTGGRPDRQWKVAIGVVVFLVILHVVASFALRSAGKAALDHDLPTLIVITSGILLSLAAMLSQAMESVTRVFYTRSDLELILSSPVPAHRLFAVRIGAIALSVSAMSLLLIGPFINVLAWQGGARWLGGYGVIVAVSLVATAFAVILTVALFRMIGPKRTRLAAQIAAAVIGGVFVVGLQLAAMFSTGTMSRIAFLRSKSLIAAAPGIDSIMWWPARAALGEVSILAVVVVASLVLFLATTALYAPRFADYTILAAGVSRENGGRSNKARTFGVRAVPSTLRHKEMLLLIRDPWLLSQSLLQLLYLLPPSALLLRSLATGGRAAIILVPVLIMAAGQLAGGLAWLTISGEDAPDLVLTAPIPQSRILRAKIEAVLECIAIVFGPFVVGLAAFQLDLAVIAALGVAASAASSVAVQLWFRSQAKRSQFRRRHTSSRIATFAEAFSSITWAATGAVAATGSWLAVLLGLTALGILAFVRRFSPARTESVAAVAI